MVFVDIEPQDVWCIHFEDMKLYKGLLLGKEDKLSRLYIRMEGAAINKIESVDSKNVFYSEDAADRALFKANLRGDKRAISKDFKDVE